MRFPRHLRPVAAGVLTLVVLSCLLPPPWLSGSDPSRAKAAEPDVRLGVVPAVSTPPQTRRGTPPGGPVEGSWCFPVDVVRYPFDLGTVDPTTIEDATLKVVFSEGRYPFELIDPVWTLLLNGHEVGNVRGPYDLESNLLAVQLPH